MQFSATISKCQTYRYLLKRIWDETLPVVTFILLNPSTADASTEDPTSRRCVAFARQWGYGTLLIVNLFAYRTAKPRLLKTLSDPVGVDNDDHIIEAINISDNIVAGWGNHGTLYNRDQTVLDLLSGCPIECLKQNKSGHPRHPLFVASNTIPIRYNSESQKEYE